MNEKWFLTGKFNSLLLLLPSANSTCVVVNRDRVYLFPILVISFSLT